MVSAVSVSPLGTDLLMNMYAYARVYNILSHEKEADRILYEDPDPATGFLILPDLKWDRKTLSTLVNRGIRCFPNVTLTKCSFPQYLSAIVFDRSIRSLRDLEKRHLPLLRNIKRSSEDVVKRDFGLESNQVRLFVHYQPSYCEPVPKQHGLFVKLTSLAVS